MKLSVRFKRFRLKAGLTQVALGKLIRKAPETISRWESGRRRIPPASYAVVALLAAGDTFTAETLKAVQNPRYAKRVTLKYRLSIGGLDDT